MAFPRDVVIVGGCGRVGLPLGVAFAQQGLRVTLLDSNQIVVTVVNSGRMPFADEGADDVLPEAIRSGALLATTDASVVASAENIVITVGTPVTGYMDPDPDVLRRTLQPLAPHLRPGQLLILRSTVFPGVTALVDRQLAELAPEVDLALCPERVAEGRAMVELRTLPQIVSGTTPGAVGRATRLFLKLTDHIVELSAAEAELAKLFTNTWRYIKFAAANQFFMLANDHGLDYGRVRDAVAYMYPRAQDLPTAGFAAGPCLFKDTMQLGAFSNNNFTLGHASMLINEGLPFYVAEQMERHFPLADMRVGILGMAFKPESSDSRSSLSYKLKRILKFKAARVLCADPFVNDDPEIIPLDELLTGADILVLATPHRAYATLETALPIVDMYGMVSEGTRI